LQKLTRSYDFNFQARSFMPVLFGVKRISRLSRRCDNKPVSAVKSSGFYYFADCFNGRRSSRRVFALKNPKLAALYTEYVTAAVTGTRDNANVFEAISDKETRNVTFKRLPRAKK
jgi:hypothetical protein